MIRKFFFFLFTYYYLSSFINLGQSTYKGIDFPSVSATSAHVTNGSKDPAICFDLAAGRKSAGDAKAENDRKYRQVGEAGRKIRGI